VHHAGGAVERRPAMRRFWLHGDAIEVPSRFRRGAECMSPIGRCIFNPRG
jgi:hypothetical protein